MLYHSGQLTTVASQTFCKTVKHNWRESNIAKRTWTAQQYDSNFNHSNRFEFSISYPGLWQDSGRPSKAGIHLLVLQILIQVRWAFCVHLQSVDLINISYLWNTDGRTSMYITTTKRCFKFRLFLIWSISTSIVSINFSFPYLCQQQPWTEQFDLVGQSYILTTIYSHLISKTLMISSLDICINK